MIDARTQALLQDIVRRASRSMLQYVGESYPWAGDGEADLLAQVHAVIAEEEQAIEGLAGFLRKKRIGLPYLGSYPERFTNINYVSLDYLLPRLLDWQRGWAGILEKDAALIADPDARAEVEKLLAVARRHVGELEKLALSIRSEPRPFGRGVAHTPP
jgi:hypothetical protein